MLYEVITTDVSVAKAISPDELRRNVKLGNLNKDDICYATQNRQDAVKFMAPKVDLVLVRNNFV